MSKKQYFLSLLFASCIGAFIALISFNILQNSSNTTANHLKFTQFSKYLEEGNFTVPKGLNFVYAAEKVSPAVVHIKSITKSRRTSYRRGEDEELFRKYHHNENYDNYYEDDYDFYSPQMTGSGVIISKDGYIVTNNHVIENAKSVEVTLFDKRSFKARVIGTDPATDLALIKINAKKLVNIEYGSSEKVAIGEWVLAIGNPFDLTSTVTAGIVSAKGRGLGLIKDYQNGSNYAIEAFIQTDAAVNPGNSGGALVNLKGELVGINTAIATNSGSYEGYSFAVPTTIVKKIMQDLKTYGTAQRALLGVVIEDVDSRLAQSIGLKTVRGVRVRQVADKGSAKQAGLRRGDIILKIDKKNVKDVAQLQGVVATYRPGDKIRITYFRKGKTMVTQATLRNKQGKVNILRKTSLQKKDILGAEFRNISQQQKQTLGIKQGVEITKLYQGKFKEKGIQEKFIITFIDEEKIYSESQLKEIMSKKRGAILIEGVYPNGTKGYYAVVMR